jgi:alpha-tubulin suppressor-like RCC1 family protein
MSPAEVVLGLPSIVAVAAGAEYSLALDATGRVWSWGRNSPSRAFPGSSDAPALLGGLSGVIAIAAAAEHALALRSDGSVLAWGSNRNGKLGDGSEVDRLAATPTLLAAQITAIAAGGESSLALRSDGTVLSWGINETGQLGSGLASPGYRPTPAAVVGLANVVAISAGAGVGHSLALDRNGAVWAWGYNNNGQLGDGTNTSRLAPVAVTGLNLN